MKMRIPSPNNMHFARAGSIVVFTGLFAWLLLSAFRSSVVDPQTTLQGFLKAVPLGIASSYYDQVFLASLAEVTLLFLLKNPSGCTATNPEFDAAGTSYQGPPTIEVLVNGKSVGRYDIPVGRASFRPPRVSLPNCSQWRHRPRGSRSISAVCRIRRRSSSAS
ncbi:hypothetical protein [Mesorhizobium sp.]|uniref:hypothetical protein n=1 Tax=Mesorhizobium sp. TaxID=1871066 RepID=UPI000FE354E5|nr:hypothetical protein [Mesorhizobium sp.]RWH71458.1 MAG: hypothetical protein EOQ84_15300 [Mesorhizobium sp.]RWL30379.1 MAG: hypothetical protein EOR58_08360 [Mesorhizobium sp.]RWL32580.1 MAG: hypothetical protein EOR63_12550 [Mesorhizobium sp.]RWL39294.1 MAG: hypothetical protein EOR59_10180 [Mesorhizobium sp.]RWL51525.1 MAG: hypothetical protein EOR61_21080 [Mesorhizobium sp.]